MQAAVESGKVKEGRWSWVLTGLLGGGSGADESCGGFMAASFLLMSKLLVMILLT